MSRPSASASRPGTRVPANLNNQLDELNAQLLDSKLTIEGLEKERDFYFGKLRDIEVLCQEQESSEFSQKVLAVLYQTEVSYLLQCKFTASAETLKFLSGRICRSRRRRSPAFSGRRWVLDYTKIDLDSTTWFSRTSRMVFLRNCCVSSDLNFGMKCPAFCFNKKWMMVTSRDDILLGWLLFVHNIFNIYLTSFHCTFMYCKVKKLLK